MHVPQGLGMASSPSNTVKGPLMSIQGIQSPGSCCLIMGLNSLRLLPVLNLTNKYEKYIQRGSRGAVSQNRFQIFKEIKTL